MKNVLIPLHHMAVLMALAVLTACSAIQGDTPLQRYIGLQLDYRVAQTAALSYKTACTPQLASHPCHSDVSRIQAISRKVQSTFDTAEAARTFGANADFATSVALASTALGELQTLLQHTSEVK